MEFNNEMKMIEQRKIMRLVCYKSKKESKKIRDCCPFKKIEIEETCKNCVWFQVVDESRRIKQWLHEKEIKPGEPVVIDLKPVEMDSPPQIDHFKRIEEQRDL